MAKARFGCDNYVFELDAGEQTVIIHIVEGHVESALVNVPYFDFIRAARNIEKLEKAFEDTNLWGRK